MLTRRRIIASTALLAFSGWVVPSARAQTGDAGAADFVRTLATDAIETLAKKEQPRPQAVARFRELLNRGFDVPYIGRWVVGRYWTQATPQQQQEFQDLFEKLIVNTYVDRFTQYSGETFRVITTKPAGERDTFVVSEITRPSGPPVNVEWRVRSKGDGQYKIIDVVVEGVSMGVTQRSEFASVITGGGGQFEALLQALRQQVARAP